MTNKEVRLESITWENIDDVIARSNSGGDFFSLPHDNDEAESYINQARNNRRHGRGDLFNAYTIQDRFVGGGQIFDTHETVLLAYWVVLGERRKGFGKAIVAALEREASRTLPSRESFELEIDSRNLASLALATTMGYTFLQTKASGVMTYNQRRL